MRLCYTFLQHSSSYEKSATVLPLTSSHITFILYCINIITCVNIFVNFYCRLCQHLVLYSSIAVTQEDKRAELIKKNYVRKSIHPSKGSCATIENSYIVGELFSYRNRKRPTPGRKAETKSVSNQLSLSPTRPSEHSQNIHLHS